MAVFVTKLYLAEEPLLLRVISGKTKQSGLKQTYVTHLL